MNMKFLMLFAWLSPALLIAFHVIPDFALIQNVQLPIGPAFTLSFMQFDVLSSAAVLCIREGDGGR